MKHMIDTAQNGFRGWRSGDPLKSHLYEKVRDWHVNVYGDGPQATDGGKPIDPTPIRPIAEQPSSHTTSQGEDLWQATGRIGQKVADAGAQDGFDDAVIRLFYEDHELVRRVAKRDLQSSIQAFLVEAISAGLQELGHAPICDPGAGRRGGRE